MKFYKVNRQMFDYFTGNTAIEGELVTEKERSSKLRYLPDEIFTPVEVSKRNTVWIFGCRWQKTA